MATRIRYAYHPTELCVLVSRQRFIHPTDGSTYQVQINEADKQFKIVEDLTGRVVTEGSGTSLHKVKIKAKDALIGLGISFEDEGRADRSDKNV